MKEYEFIVAAIEEELSDRLIALICLEDYGFRSQPDGYRALFDHYGDLHKEYEECIIADCSDELSQERFLEIKRKWEAEREEMLTSFMKDLNDDGINEHKRKYEEQLRKQEVQTLGKRIAIYPYLVSSVCKGIEGSNS